MTFSSLNVRKIHSSDSLYPNKSFFRKDGFYLETNESDALFLDDIIFKDFTVAEKEELIHQRYYGFGFPTIGSFGLSLAKTFG